MSGPKLTPEQTEIVVGQLCNVLDAVKELVTAVNRMPWLPPRVKRALAGVNTACDEFVKETSWPGR